MEIREKKSFDSNAEVILDMQREKKYFGKTEQRDARRYSGFEPVALSPEVESGLLRHFSDHCVAVIVEFPIND